MNYFICGFSGAGKSYLLKQLEHRMQFKQFQFIDLDHLIDQKYAAAEGHDSLGDFIETNGMEHFRKIECEEIEQLNGQENIFLALGGGSLNERTMPFLKDWQGMWLATDFETCWKRIQNDANRPLVKKGEVALKQLYKEREKFYGRYPAVTDVGQVLEMTKS